MSGASVRLILAAAAFLAWLGWLAYLAVNHVRTPTIVLSRPQFLVSSIDVIAQVTDPETRLAKVETVHWPVPPGASLPKAGDEIRVANLPDTDGWTGPGSYILPLAPDGRDAFGVVSIPRSPGYAHGRPRIYPATPQTRMQLDSIQKLPQTP